MIQFFKESNLISFLMCYFPKVLLCEKLKKKKNNKKPMYILGRKNQLANILKSE